MHSDVRTIKWWFIALLLLIPIIGLASDSFKTTAKAFIDVPDTCYQVERVEGVKVFLVKGSGECRGFSGKVPVELESGQGKAHVFLDGEYWREQEIKEFGLDAVSDLRERAKELVKRKGVPETEEGAREKGMAAAERVSEFFNSGRFHDRLTKERTRLEGGLFNDVIDEYYPDATASKPVNGRLPDDRRIYIFISSSIPERTLRAYVEELDRLRDPHILMVMRGGIGGLKKIKPTLEFISGLVMKDPGCKMQFGKCEAMQAEVQIDPLLFRRYGIKTVPAVVYVPHINLISKGSEGLPEAARTDDYYQISGDISLGAALGRIHDEKKDMALEKVIARLNGGFYQKED